MTTLTPAVDVRRAGERFHTRIDWLDSHHSFSFGPHHDPANTHFGVLMVNNDDVVRAGTGFDTHPHRDMEIVTWVLDGSLVHQDSTGHSGLIYPGLAQRMSAGTGILHSEKNDSWRLDAAHGGTAAEHHDDVHFVQMWVVPDTERITPGYEQLDINSELDRGGLHPIASGQGHDAAISIRQRHAVLWGGRLKAGETVTVPEGNNVHLFVATGAVSLEGAGALAEGDAVRLTGAGSPTMTARPGGVETLIWVTA
jgi:quercetin 2,3-dioxygenase